MNLISIGIMLGDITTFVDNILKWIFVFIDSVVYQLVAVFYNIFLAIVRIDFGDVNGIFDNLLQRIYLVLGIFMLFKVSFNLLQMMVDPDKVNDSKIGGGAMVKHIFISIIMLVAFPLVFEVLGDIQKAIIDNGIVETIILGDGATALSEDLDKGKPGAAFSWSLFSSFLRPGAAQGYSWQNTTGNVKKQYDSVWRIDGTGNYRYRLDFGGVITDSQLEYTPIVSTIVGALMIYFLVMFSFDIGIRTFKLMLLEVIAPIPIVSYMSPGKGEDIFNRFKDEYIKTYLELFVRLAIIYLTLLLSNKLLYMFTPQNAGALFKDGVKLDTISLAIASVILIVALFMFARKIPELAETVFGFKLGNSGSAGAASRGILGAAGLIGGAAIGGAAGFTQSLLRGDNVLKAGANLVGGAARSGVGAARSGLGSGQINGKALQGLSQSVGTGIRNTAQISEATRAAGGWWNMTRARVDNALGGEYRAKRRMEALDGAAQSAEKNAQSAQGTMSQFESMRRIAEQQYAQSQGLSLDDVRSRDRATFDTNVNNWIRTSGGGSTSFMTALNNYNASSGTSVTTGSFVADEANAITDYQSAARASVTANAAKDQWLNDPSRNAGRVYGPTNKARSERRQAAQNRTGQNGGH